MDEYISFSSKLDLNISKPPIPIWPDDAKYNVPSECKNGNISSLEVLIAGPKFTGSLHFPLFCCLTIHRSLPPYPPLRSDEKIRVVSSSLIVGWPRVVLLSTLICKIVGGPQTLPFLLETYMLHPSDFFFCTSHFVKYIVVPLLFKTTEPSLPAEFIGSSSITGTLHLPFLFNLVE